MASSVPPNLLLAAQLAMPVPSLGGPGAPQMDLQTLAALAALQQQHAPPAGDFASLPGLPAVDGGKATPNRGQGGRTRSGDSRSSSAYASRHQAAEQRRRNRINERLEALRRLVPHAERANTATFLEEVIKYITQLRKRQADLERALSTVVAGGGGGGAATAAAAAAAAAAMPPPPPQPPATLPAVWAGDAKWQPQKKELSAQTKALLRQMGDEAYGEYFPEAGAGIGGDDEEEEEGAGAKKKGAAAAGGAGAAAGGAEAEGKARPGAMSEDKRRDQKLDGQLGKIKQLFQDKGFGNEAAFKKPDRLEVAATPARKRPRI